MNNDIFIYYGHQDYHYLSTMHKYGITDTNATISINIHIWYYDH